MKSNETKELARTSSHGLFSPFGDIEKWFEDAFRRPFSILTSPVWTKMGLTEKGEITPAIDVFEDGGDVVLKAELPGMNKEDIEIDLHGDVLTISGEKKEEEEVEKRNYYRFERSYGSFSRSMSLPAEVQVDKAKAHFRDGVLEIRMPKTEEARTREKKIEIE